LVRDEEGVGGERQGIRFDYPSRNCEDGRTTRRSVVRGHGAGVEVRDEEGIARERHGERPSHPSGNGEDGRAARRSVVRGHGIAGLIRDEEGVAGERQGGWFAHPSGDGERRRAARRCVVFGHRVAGIVRDEESVAGERQSDWFVHPVGDGKRGCAARRCVVFGDCSAACTVGNVQSVARNCQGFRFVYPVRTGEAERGRATGHRVVPAYRTGARAADVDALRVPEVRSKEREGHEDLGEVRTGASGVCSQAEKGWEPFWIDNSRTRQGKTGDLSTTSGLPCSIWSRAEQIDGRAGVLSCRRQKLGDLSEPARLTIGKKLRKSCSPFPKEATDSQRSNGAEQTHEPPNFANAAALLVSLASACTATATRGRNARNLAVTPRRFAQEALGNSSRAVHEAYAKGAQIVCPALDEYEREPTNIVRNASPLHSEPPSKNIALSM